MATIKALLTRLEAVDPDTICRQTVEQSVDEMAVKQREQLYSGKDAQGEAIFPPYRPFTVAIKELKGQPTDRVTLRDTGEFYAGVYVRVSGDKVQTDSVDEKSTKLQEKYGDEIFGLNAEKREEVVRETMRPAFRTLIEKATGLKMK